MAALVDSFPRRRRNCGSKARSGCQNCKNRHVKCDERKPACLQCSERGAICTYPDAFRSVSVGMNIIHYSHSAPKSPMPMPASIGPGFGLPLDSRDRSSLYYFRSKVTSEISTLLSAKFWNSYVLPMSASRGSVQHAIVALATQYRAWAEGKLVPGTSPSYSLHSYGKAIRSLNDRIEEKGNNSSVVEETLITCLLFVCFNVLQGNDASALTHLQAGLQVYTEYFSGQRRPFLLANEPEDPIEELVMSFKRLDLQAAWYLGSYQMKSLASVNAWGTESSPLQLDFASIADARRALDEITCSAFHFMRSKAEPVKYSGNAHHSGKDSGSKPGFNSLTSQRDVYINQLYNWEMSFRSFQTETSRHWSVEEMTKISNHLICYNTIFISLSVCLSPDEIAYDLFLPQFVDILDHVEYIFNSANRSYTREQGQKSSSIFNLEMSIIQPLYFTALKCRDAHLRHRSVEFLQRCGKEGVWDGDVMANVARYVVTLEESKRCFNPLTKSLELFERDRICGTAVNSMRAERKVWVECSMRKWHSSTIEMGMESLDMDQGYKWEFWDNVIYL